MRPEGSKDDRAGRGRLLFVSRDRYRIADAIAQPLLHKDHGALEGPQPEPLKGKAFVNEATHRGVKATPALLMPVIILGGIYGGIMTPTEAAAVAVIYAVPVGFLIYRGLNMKTFLGAGKEAATSVGAIKLMILSQMFVLESVPQALVEAIFSISEAFTAVQTGVVDGVVGSSAEGYYASFRDVTTTDVPVNTHFEVWYMIINSGTLAELSDADRAVLETAAVAFEAKRWETAEADQGAFEQKLADNGASIVSLSDAELAATASHVRAQVWPQVLADEGQEWGQSVLDKIAE